MECTNGFVMWCVDSEPELPGDMPDELWELIKTAVENDDRKGMSHILKTVVRQTKKGIKNRIERGVVNYGGE